MSVLQPHLHVIVIDLGVELKLVMKAGAASALDLYSERHRRTLLCLQLLQPLHRAQHMPGHSVSALSVVSTLQCPLMHFCRAKTSMHFCMASQATMLAHLCGQPHFCMASLTSTAVLSIVSVSFDDVSTCAKARQACAPEPCPTSVSTLWLEQASADVSARTVRVVRLRSMVGCERCSFGPSVRHIVQYCVGKFPCYRTSGKHSVSQHRPALTHVHISIELAICNPF